MNTGGSGNSGYHAAAGFPAMESAEKRLLASRDSGVARLPARAAARHGGRPGGEGGKPGFVGGGMA